MQGPSTANLLGRSAVVTGSSSGIGRAIALELASAGADVLVHARQSRDRAEQVAEEIRALGRRSEVVLCDLTDDANHTRLVDMAWGWNEIDIWVNNAGADVLTGEIGHLAFEEKFKLLWKVDVLATVQLSRSAGARMKARGRGVLLNMGWDQAALGMEGDSGEMFGTTKGAVAAYTRAAARSLAPAVRVNCLAPGWIRTAWGDSASDYWRQRAVGETLLGRWGTPEDVARVARFLASDEADFITGQVVNVNGGFAAG